MRLAQIRDYFKTSFVWDEAISSGKIDKGKEKAICFYNSKRITSPIKAIDSNTYKYKKVTILLRYTKNQDKAEQMANSIYEFFNDRNFVIEDKTIISQHLYSEPITLNTDDNGVYEYSFEIDFLEK